MKYINILRLPVSSFGGLAATRFFLGLAGAGIYPGCESQLLITPIKVAPYQFYQVIT